MRMAKIILLHFGAFVPGIQQSSARATTIDEPDDGEVSPTPSQSQMTDGCKGIYSFDSTLVGG